MGKKKDTLKSIAEVAAAGAAFANLVVDIVHRGKSDLGADWTCDNCGANLNRQLGFFAGGTWTCTECGYENDVSEANIIGTRLEEDGTGHPHEVLDIPIYDEDPEDY